MVASYQASLGVGPRAYLTSNYNSEGHLFRKTPVRGLYEAYKVLQQSNSNFAMIQIASLTVCIYPSDPNAMTHRMLAIVGKNGSDCSSAF